MTPAKPIPDEVLREIGRGAFGPNYAANATFDPPLSGCKGEDFGCTVGALARELLALREAARKVSGEYDIAELIDAILEMRELLPKEAP